MRATYKSDWQAIQRRDRTYYETAARGFPDPNALSPHSTHVRLDVAGDAAFHGALQIAFGDGSNELFQQYVVQANEWLDKLLAENGADAGKHGVMFLWDRGTRYAYRAVVKGMSRNTVPDLTDLRHAAQDLTDFLAKDTSNSDAGRNDYIAIAEWFIVCGEFDEASKMLKRARWKYYAERIKHVQTMLVYARDAKPIEQQAELDTYFDKLRDPFEPGKQRLPYAPSFIMRTAWGALYDYRILGNRPFSWQRVFDTVSA